MQTDFPPITVPPPLPPGGGAALRAALIDSRQRWRGLVAAAGDFAFETDEAGRFTFVWPDQPLGWPDGALLGRPAETLLANPGEGFDPFGCAMAVRDRTAWLRLRAGGAALFSLSIAPLPGGGVRGLGRDMTAENMQASTVAAGLRRAEVMEHIATAMREELLTRHMIATVLRTASQAVGAAGAALLQDQAGGAVTRHGTGPVPQAVLDRGAAVLAQGLIVSAEPHAGHDVLACAVLDRLSSGAVLLFWRDDCSRGWSADDRALALALTGTVRLVLEQDRLQSGLAHQSRTDALTGLLNRRAFLADLDRRLARLNPQYPPELPGVLIYMDLDHFKRLNDALGHEAGDRALMAAADLLRLVFRPTDLVARIGGDEFIVWLDGMDVLAAAERAEQLRVRLPAAVAAVVHPDAPPVTVSIGIAPSPSVHDSDPNVEGLVRRADLAMYTAKQAGRGQWQVAASRGMA